MAFTETSKMESEDDNSLSDIQKAYIDSGISKGIADMEAGRGLSDPQEIKQDILRGYELKKQAYLNSLK